jgi:RNA polymerase sigma-70 factor (ECF subfamily)
MTRDEEVYLLQQINEDPKYFGVVFDTYYKNVFSYIFKRVADYDISKDIAAETFLKAFLNIHSFVWKDISISSWIYRIATNEINYYFRKRKYLLVSLNNLMDKSDYDLLRGYDDVNDKQSIELEVEHHGEFLKVHKCLAQLDIRYQEVLSLRYFEKKSIIEIAEILGKKEGTVKSLLSRGVEKLRILMCNAT